MIFHIPHSSTTIPKELRPFIILDDKELSTEILNITDAYTDELFGCHSTDDDTIIKFPVSRLVLDPERFVDDSKEQMSKSGMGVIYTKTSTGKKLRNNMDPSWRDNLMKKYYKPHHAHLTDSVRNELKDFGYSIIVDCHSFPSKPLPCELDQRVQRPDICIGTESTHTPEVLKQNISKLLKDQNLKVFINRPFSGTIVPSDFYEQNKYVFSIMIEVNRRLYMDEKTGEKSTDFPKIKSIIKYIIEEIRASAESHFFKYWDKDYPCRRNNDYPWHWTEGRINKKKPHFELKYGDIKKVNYEDFIPVALLSHHIGCKCHVEFILKKEVPNAEDIFERARREIDYYLIELKERNPIGYLEYHCNTALNIYSDIHWCLRPVVKKKKKRGGKSRIQLRLFK